MLNPRQTEEMQGSGGAAEVYDNDDAVLYPEGAGI
jgi:hypothetical protein